MIAKQKKVINSNTIANKTVTFVFFVDPASITDIISSHSVTDVLFTYLLFSQLHVPGFQL